jgi:hypothetical protein
VPCEDLWELTAHTNDIENNATALASLPVDDCAPEEPVSGLLDGADDVDWYSYQGADSSCIVNPRQHVSNASASVRLCAFLACVDSSAGTFFTCPSGTVESQSPDGRSGCCGTGTDVDIEFNDLDCMSSNDDSAFVFLRVDDPAGDPTTCTSYTLRYTY